jgi:rhodanese-related sulfurtransferase
MKQHHSKFLTLVEEAKTRIHEMSAEQLKHKLDEKQKILILDVREDNEWLNTAHIPTAVHLSKGLVERDIEKINQDASLLTIAYCSGGFRSAVVADSLQKMGYVHVFSLSGGLQAWVDAGYEIESC